MGLDVLHATGSCLGKLEFSNGKMEFEMCTFVPIPYEACPSYRKQDGLLQSGQDEKPKGMKIKQMLHYV